MALDIEFNGSTTDTVKEVIGYTHGRMGFNGETRTLDRIVAVLDNPEFAIVKREDGASKAAEAVREILWNRFSGGGASAAATCSLFHALGREDELGWVVGEGHYGNYDREYVSDAIAEIRAAKV